MVKEKISLARANIVHYPAHSKKRKWSIYGNLREIYRYGNSKHVSFHGVTLDDKGEFPSSTDSFSESYLAALLAGTANKNTQEGIIGKFHKICQACPVYPLAEMVRAQRENDLIICESIVKESKIADPNSVKLVSIDQSKEGTEAYFQPELPANFQGCAVAQALLGIHRGETIPPYSPSK